jgi:hypothetical protein
VSIATSSIPTFSIPTSSTLTTTPNPVRAAVSARAGAVGGLVFTASILAQNALRAAAPANDASPADIISFYNDHRATALALAVLFPIGAVGLTAFVGSLVARARGAARMPAVVGGLAVAALIAMFGIVSATELALSTYVHRGSPDPSVVSALWLTHMSVFGVNLMFIGIALAGLSAACVRMGLLRHAWRTAGLVGAAALGVGAACTPAILNASAIFGLAVAGFLVWGAFVVVTSISLLRHANTD